MIYISISSARCNSWTYEIFAILWSAGWVVHGWKTDSIALAVELIDFRADEFIEMKHNVRIQESRSWHLMDLSRPRHLLSLLVLFQAADFRADAFRTTTFRLNPLSAKCFSIKALLETDPFRHCPYFGRSTFHAVFTIRRPFDPPIEFETDHFRQKHIMEA
jgi:hypothetical protein